MIVEISPSVTVGANQKLLLIAGPCQIESREHCLSIAEFLRKETERFPVSLVFKSSFDKANRTSVSGKRGIGIDEGLRILEEVRNTIGAPVLTDVHTEEQARLVAAAIEFIPAATPTSAPAKASRK